MDFFCSLASGSTGNSALYVSGGVRILIDAGVPTRYINSHLAAFGLRLADLTHVLITHGHSDHVGALPVLGKHTNAQLLCSQDAYYGLQTQNWDCAVFEPGDELDLLGCRVQTYPTPHDAPGSCGFVLGEGARSLSYCTDLGDMPPEVYYTIAGSKNVFIESNHDIPMLKRGPYPAVLKRRILSETGHLSNERCAQTVAALARCGARWVMLGHLSQENNTPLLAEGTSIEALRRLGALQDVSLGVAPPGRPCDVLVFAP